MAARDGEPWSADSTDQLAPGSGPGAGGGGEGPLLSPPPPPDTRAPLLLFTPRLREAFALAHSLPATPSSLRCRLAPYLRDAGDGGDAQRGRRWSSQPGGSALPRRPSAAPADERSAAATVPEEAEHRGGPPPSATGTPGGGSTETADGDAAGGDAEAPRPGEDCGEECRAVTLELVKEVSVVVQAARAAAVSRRSSACSGRDSQTAALALDTSLRPAGYWVHELLQGSSVYVAPRIKQKRSPSLVARLDQITVANAHAEYARMVAAVANPNDYETAGMQANERLEVKAMEKEITAIINILFTIVGVFVAVYWTSPHVTNDVGYVSAGGGREGTGSGRLGRAANPSFATGLVGAEPTPSSSCQVLLLLPSKADLDFRSLFLQQILMSFSAAIVVGIAETWLWVPAWTPI
ncbi:MAG: endoplasmic reticulum-based factor for assembly of V-ATPase-domain-containing protein [Olpidium bornovanus]|uniref:Endoplasmic reticulum-based factor for assembly of V-ATPase-domain-containing protein n=1 Tax=Olpidium bornovanus TaxID=278681 RepID=A0A8H7ZNP0_9FUNG|nr:MAG: endoplasmic reticulum-based factor for assembly of V-ATPase-domain-containing protein [Olpidium bornovanus]